MTLFTTYDICTYNSVNYFFWYVNTVIVPWYSFFDLFFRGFFKVVGPYIENKEQHE